MLFLVGCDPAAMVAFPVEKRRSNNERIMMVPGADGSSGIAFVVVMAGFLLLVFFCLIDEPSHDVVPCGAYNLAMIQTFCHTNRLLAPTAGERKTQSRTQLETI